MYEAILKMWFVSIVLIKKITNGSFVSGSEDLPHRSAVNAAKNPTICILLITKQSTLNIIANNYRK